VKGGCYDEVYQGIINRDLFDVPHGDPKFILGDT